MEQPYSTFAILTCIFSLAETFWEEKGEERMKEELRRMKRGK
jgi:hypothetical protein